MVALAGSPWRGLSRIQLQEASGATRSFTASIDDVIPQTATGDQSTWEGTPGQSFTLRYEHAITGTTTSGVPSEVRIIARLPNSTQVGDTWTISNPTTQPQTRTFHFDDNPLNQSAGNARAGMIEILIEADSQSGNPAVRYGLRSDGTTFGDGIPALMTHNWGQGYYRSNQILSSLTISDASLGGAEPAEFWYPDPIHLRATLNATWWETLSITGNVDTGTRTKASSGTGTTRNFSWSNTSGEKVDADFTAGSKDVRLTLPTNDFGGDNRFAWSATGQLSGWSVSSLSLFDADRFPVDPSVTITNLTLDNGDIVYNRGEDVSGTLQVENAGGETFTPQGTDRLRTLTGGTTVEETVDTVNRAAGTLTWSHTWATSGNVAPATDAGDDKTLRWDDVQSGVNSPTADSSTVGDLSSKLNLAVHMQERQTALDPTLDTDERQASNIGYYGFKVTNVRGEAYNGASGVISLRPDDDSLSAVETATLTSQQVNGYDGYTPLTSWTDPLPGGGWDIWASTAFTNDGNTGTKARDGTDVFDVTLIAFDPNLAVVLVVGGSGDRHFQAGDTIELDCQMVNQSSHTPVESLSAEVVFRRTDDNRTWQFYDSNLAWSDDYSAPDTPVAASPIAMTANADDYGFQLDVATDATWTNNFEVVVVVSNSGVFYRQVVPVEVVGAANSHDGYQFDGAGFVGFPSR